MMQRSLFAHLNVLSSFSGHFCLFFCPFIPAETAPLSATTPPPSWLVFLLSFYCTRWLYIIETALPFHFHGTNSQLHSSKMRSGGGGGTQVRLQFQTPLDFLLLRKGPLEKHKGCFFFFFFPLNDKSQCFPDMTRISKMALQRMQ